MRNLRLDSVLGLLRKGALLTIAAFSLGACGGGSSSGDGTAAPSNATGTASAGTSTGTASASTRTGTTGTSGTGGKSTATAVGQPTISGSSVPSVVAGTAYSFKPTASDPNGDTLAFSIQNKPAWATFNTATGQLSGTPSAANVGTYSNIVISVTDGTSSASLSPFVVAVTQIATGSATLSWMPPTVNTDGSALTNLSGYHIYYGTNANALTQIIDVNNVGITSYVITNLAAGTTYYFALRAYTSTGVDSDMSNVAAKNVT